MLDLPAVRLFIFTGTSLILRLVDFNSSKLEIGSGYSRGYFLAKRFMTWRSAARKPEVGSWMRLLEKTLIIFDKKWIPKRRILEER